ncbi:hypothetical protein [Sphingomonas sp. LM7]|uniref:hypothetical protein n=1 Tax=Sphingomonas sp. LM7 TaxID=1938607 RepID=UPI00098405F4|nr:hypothetical protein [Sphingomonas sp. LM7]AQR72696.1 hypothetical protein BXU08_02535 [Sphingomonas sp. LM7]
MRRRIIIGVGCAIFLLPIAAVALPLVRTSEPATQPHYAKGLKLELDNWSDPPASVRSGWTIGVDYPDLQRVRAYLTATTGGVDPKSFKITARALAHPHDVQAPECYAPTPDPACIVVIDLQPGDLASGLEVTITGQGALKSRSFTRVFQFERRTTYSSLWWEAMVGV